MFQMKNTLMARSKNPIKVAVVGIGKMGRSLVDRLIEIEGMWPQIIYNRTLENIKIALKVLDFKEENVVVLRNLEDLAKLDCTKIGITDDLDIATQSDVDIVVEATGSSDHGAITGLKSIENGKHIVMLNIETDATVGPILYKKAKEKGVIYSGSGGDEPAAIVELISFVQGLGLNVIAAGKGKNNPKDIYATPESLECKAKESGLSPSTLTSFVDATNTMIELCSVSNATGMVPDIPGCHGIEATSETLASKLNLKGNGGVLNNHFTLDYVMGMAPGVYVGIEATTKETRKILEFLSMGSGPVHTIVRPFHLCSLETPGTIYRAVILGTSDIAPIKGQVCDVVAKAKRDIKAGESIDGIGSRDSYGVLYERKDIRGDGVPIGLIIDGTKALVDIPKDSLITYDMVQLVEDSTVVHLRQEQDKLDV